MFDILLGHLIGDYLLQPKNMAVHKSDSGFEGFATCLVHSLIYSLSVFIFFPEYTVLTFILIFLTHYLIDRYSLANYWLKLVRGRSHTDTGPFSKEFYAIVYTVVDNTLHLLLLRLVWLIN
jgi:hypothetical protein